jgi:hypothetical protein
MAAKKSIVRALGPSAAACSCTLVLGVDAASDPALQAPAIITSPGPGYGDSTRRFQGIPGIERAGNGRLWAVWYAGGTRESPENYVVVSTSGDDGRTWDGPRVVIDPPGFVRAFDAGLWLDPRGRLWLSWAQTAGHWDGRGGVWVIVSDDPMQENPRWSAPRRIADGVLMNKPLVARSGAWLFPINNGANPSNLPFINERDKLNLTSEQVAALSHDLGDIKGPNVYSSTDGGKTFRRLGGLKFPVDDAACEHMIVERRDGRLWMLVRTRRGIAGALSSDGGRTWSEPTVPAIEHPVTRFFVRRLRSGRLLLVRHSPPNGKDRSHLTAHLSGDDGATWSKGLLLDDRMNISYPDGVQAPDGKIYIIYDRERFTEKEILLATFGEDDIRRGAPGEEARLRVVVNKAGEKAP